MARRDVWLIYEPGPDCQCWRDALCPHGWSWTEENEDRHADAFGGAYESAADAIRETYGWRGFGVIGPLIRRRYSDSCLTRQIFIMPRGLERLADDHDASGGPAPLWIVQREGVTRRSRLGDEIRTYADAYRRRNDAD